MSSSSDLHSMNNEFEENDGSPHPKKRKINFGQNYMQKFGFKDGSGLGRNADGIVEPVEVSKQKGTRGLGYTVAALEGARSSYDPSLYKNLIHEDVPQWLENNHDDSISKEILVSWMKKGPQMKRLSDESEFCSPGVPVKVFTSKDVLSHISEKDVKAGRRRANPYESISHAIFLNRAAMKMANMDAVLDRMFTKPKNINGEDAIANGDLLYFADVCAGPGGFSEFVFHMKKWRAKGFGFTLRKENDFKLDDFLAGPSETFHPYYGSKGDGDIYDTDNVESFVAYVMRQTNNKGVHFMMADGGMPIEMKNDQELICKKLYLCQCLVAMEIVRTGGHFVLKLYDLFTNFSVGLIYLMFRSFKYILIMKPRTSRPANSERYLVCKFKRNDCHQITEHMSYVNKQLPINLGEGKLDVLELVPLNVLMEDRDFFDYIYSSNNRIAKLQIISLNKLAAFCEDEDLKDDRQQQLRKLCLDEWGIPDEARAEPKKTDVQSKCRQLTGASTLHNFETNMKDILIENLATFAEQVRSVYDWQMVLLRSKNDKFTSGFYISLGKKNIWQYVQNGWHKLSDVQHFVLPADTLVYGEIVEETQGEGKSQMKYFAFHIIDGLFLGGEDIRNRNLNERWKLCELFAEAVSDESFSVRVKNKYPLRDISSMQQHLSIKTNKNGTKSCYMQLNAERSFRVGGIMFLTDVKNDYHRHWSRNNRSYYFYCPLSTDKFYESEREKGKKVYSEFKDTFQSRKLWLCEADSNLTADEVKRQIEQFSTSVFDKTRKDSK